MVSVERGDPILPPASGPPWSPRWWFPWPPLRRRCVILCTYAVPPLVVDCCWSLIIIALPRERNSRAHPACLVRSWAPRTLLRQALGSHPRCDAPRILLVCWANSILRVAPAPGAIEAVDVERRTTRAIACLIWSVRIPYLYTYRLLFDLLTSLNKTLSLFQWVRRSIQRPTTTSAIGMRSSVSYIVIAFYCWCSNCKLICACRQLVLLLAR